MNFFYSKFSLKQMSVAIAAVIVFSTSSFASTDVRGEVRYNVETLNRVQFDGEFLEIGYTTGGGYEKHEADVQVKLIKDGNSDNSFRAEVQVFDVIPKEDFAEALLSVTKKVNLRDLIHQERKRLGLGFRTYVEIQLPQVQVNLNGLW